MAAGKTTAMDVPEVVERVLGEGAFTVEKFADSFGVLVDAAGGIEKLRSMVLQLGVAGALTTDRQRLVGKTGDGSVEGVDVPFPIPEGWAWTQLGDIAEFINGDRSKNYPSKQHQVASGIPFINAGHLENGVINHKDMNYITKERFEILRSGKVQTGDVLYCLRGSLGKSALVANVSQGAIASSLVIIRAQPTSCFPAFLLKYLGSPLALRLIRKYDNGTAQPNLSATDVARFDIPLPPLAEQKRIVARVDRLMALIDQLEAKQNRKREVGARFSKASLEALTTAESPQEFTTAWTRIQSTWSTILDRADKVPGLRRLALDVATKGLLVPPKPGEDARNLLGQIGADVPQVAPEDAPFEIPSHWMWMRLGSLGAFVGGGTPSKNNSEFWKGNIPWVSPKDMKRLYIDDAEDHISAEAVDSSATKLIRSPSLLMVLRGMILAHSFPVALTTKTVTINQDMKALVLRVPAMAEFALLACRAARDRVLAKVQRSSHGTCRLESEDVANLPIPIPPLAEQKRIVAKVEHLMELCDVLEAALRRSEDRAAKLVEAVVQEMVA